MNKSSILNLIEKIKLPDIACEKAMSLLSKDENKIEKAVKKATLERYAPLKNTYRFNKEKNALFSLAAVVAQADKIHEKYAEKGIPDAIYYDTMSDITVWVNTAQREKNVCGLLELSWVRHEIFMNLFKIGRLQYQFYKTDYLLSGLCLKDIQTAPIPDKSPVLNIHIPEGGKLLIDSCKESLLDSREFFEKYYPEYNYSGFVCDSWLLDPKNSEFMAPDSNIVNFKNVFDLVVPTKFTSSEIQRRLWGNETNKTDIIKNYAENTDLQRRTKKYLLSGGCCSNGYGFITK